MTTVTEWWRNKASGLETKSFSYEQAVAMGELANHRVRETGRWTREAKATLLRAIDVGAMTPAEAAQRYALSELEIAEWRRGVLSRKDVQPHRVR